MRYLLFSLMLICTGCFGPQYIKINDRYPIYALPPKSTLAKISEADLSTLTPETKKNIIDTVNSLKTESIQLRTILESYNNYATSKNKENKLY